jgi:hypothetical protein
MRSAFAVLLLAAGAAQDAEPGLVGEYFELSEAPSDFPKLPADRKPTFVRVDPQVNFDDVAGDFYGSRLSSNFYARWSGLLRVEKAGVYNLSLESDDGSRLRLDGKLVVDNGGLHGMAEKSANVELSAGDHPILIEFFQAGGDAGCVAWWRPPAAPRVPIPAKHLFHPKGAENVAWDKAAWEKRPKGKAPQAGPKKGTGKYALMDRGTLTCGTIDTLWGGKGNFVHKGFAIALDKEAQAHVCFDSELLKVASGWTGGGIGWPSGRDGIEGQPFAEGTIRFGTRKNTLGWARGEDWRDPRPKPYGPLPPDWGRYRGLFRHGEKIILSYTVGGADILELPGFHAPGLFTRTFQVEKVSAPLRMLVCEGEGRPRVSVGPADAPARVDAQGSRTELVVTGPGRFVLGIGEGALPAAADLGPYLRGGPGRNEEVTTVGTLGQEPGAYVVDTLTVPSETPSKSYMRLTGVDFFSDGTRAAVCTMDGDVWVVSGIDGKLEKLTWRRFASGLFQTLGLRIVRDVVYTLGRDQITRLVDLNGDGEADFYENFNNDCGVTPNYHEFAHDLHTDSEGNFYYAKGSDLGSAKVPQHGCVVKVSKDGKSSQVWTTGFRAPNGISVGPGDVVTASDNQGNWIPTTPINYITRQGQFCGFVPCSFQSPAPKERPDNPLCWIPWAMDNSGGGQVWCTSDRWGPFKDELFHLSYGKCALFYILRERAGETWQGGAIRFPFKFLSGSMRGRFNPGDGQLYVVGMRGWQTDANRDGCFQRVRYTGKPAYLPLRARVTPRGIDLTFTDPLDKETAGDVDSYSATWCNLRWTSGYGSDEYWVSDPDKKGREPLPIRGASVSSDGRTVSLAIEGLRPVYYLVLRYRFKAADGAPISQELTYTINRAP